METELTFVEKISTIQNALKAPKDKKTYAYSYRNAEEILGKVKPLLLEHSLVITLADEIVAVGEPCKWFIRSTAEVTNGTERITGVGIAQILSPSVNREGKASMNESQATGATSSYARKYALGALFGIDDGDDADDAKYQPAAMNSQGPARPPAKKQTASQTAPSASQGSSENIDPQVFKELCFLPGKGRTGLNLAPDVTKQIWDECYRQGWKRGKFDADNKTWNGTQIPMSAVPTIARMFCEAAGLNEEQTNIRITQILAHAPVKHMSALDEYSDEPF
jgi:hypothetical protein